ncbi:MAG: Membrane protein insertase YidC [Cellvibrionales bacterium UBA7375]|nr:membrane protein insertase YidC [Gammaproteobacteria bacterium]CAI8166604.1 MAG: Membrane protein insertase YidC [Cellvibrionales bacterium UBA7375]
MNWQKNVILAAIGVVVWLLVVRWTDFEAQFESLPVADQQSQIPVEQLYNESAPSISTLPVLVDDRPQLTKLLVDNQKTVTITTDVIKVTIDTLGGDVVETQLLQNLDKMADEGGQPISILTRSSGNEFIAESGLIGANGTDTAAGRPVFSTTANTYELADGQQGLEVDFVYNQGGIEIIKRFEFKAAQYQIGIRYIIRNLSSEPWLATFFGQFRRDSHQPETDSSTGMKPFLGAAIREQDKNYSKYDFSDIDDKTVKTSLQGGWLAFVQHYFVSAWVPPQDEKNSFSLRKLQGNDIYLMAVTGEKINVSPGQTGEYKVDLYVGPKNQDVLQELSEYLDLTIDYGFLWMLAKPIFAALQIIQGFLGNWGWSIIILTILIKILLYPLSAASLKSMAKMRTLQPEMARIKELYGDDRQKAGQEQMALFKKHRVNPLGGCFPMLLQMPVFIALYWVLSESVEIRHSPWIIWIQDLSAKDPLFILPLIMGASMFLMQKLQPAPTDPMQAKVFQLMPVVFTFFFMMFPAGLVLYWTVNNLLSILQQWYVNRQIAAAVK